uniref:Methyltransferase domain-containing protein n=1 Tax=Chenopodium quinoa TaxID=63459 RepID=A0A803LDW8_CHEQI
IKAMVADMLDLPFADDSFDVVIEKGTMDVLFVDNGDPWNPKAETISKVMAMLQGIHRVLKPNGIYISISFGQSHFRRPLFEAPDFTWSMKWSTFGDGFHYFFYTLKKGTRSLNSYQPCERLNLSFHQSACIKMNWKVKISYSGPTLMNRRTTKKVKWTRSSVIVTGSFAILFSC